MYIIRTFAKIKAHIIIIIILDIQYFILLLQRLTLIWSHNHYFFRAFISKFWLLK